LKVLIRRWGNSASVRIPAPILAASRLALDQAVDMREEDGRIIIEKLSPASADIDELIDCITPENRHAEIDFGPPRGEESW
jgi:antitoxin MazE